MPCSQIMGHLSRHSFPVLSRSSVWASAGSLQLLVWHGAQNNTRAGTDAGRTVPRRISESLMNEENIMRNRRLNHE